MAYIVGNIYEEPNHTYQSLAFPNTGYEDHEGEGYYYDIDRYQVSIPSVHHHAGSQPTRPRGMEVAQYSYKNKNTVTANTGGKELHAKNTSEDKLKKKTHGEKAKSRKSKGRQCPCWVVAVAVSISVVLGIAVAVFTTLQMTKENADQKSSTMSTKITDDRSPSTKDKSMESTTETIWSRPPRPCGSNPCQSGQTCHNIGTGSYSCQCPGGYTLQPCADVYLPMDRQVGNIIEGYGMVGLLSGVPGQGIPSISHNSGVLESALHLSKNQWLDLGLQNDRCIGCLAKCKNGFTFATYFKMEGERKWNVIFQNMAILNGIYMGVKLMAMEPLSLHNDIYLHMSLIAPNNSRFGREVYCIENSHTWQHIAFTFGADGNFQLYCNGKTPWVREVWYDDYTPGSTIHNITIGNFIQTPDDYFTGYIDETFMWESSQPKDVINELYNRGKSSV